MTASLTTRRDAIYTRLSMFREEATSIERQDQACQARSLADGATVAMVRADPDHSGWNMKVIRPGLNEILAAVERGEIDRLMVWKLDRLARNTAECLRIVRVLRDHGAELVSVSEGIDTRGAFGEFFLTIMAACAQLESDTISYRVRNAYAHAAKAGKAKRSGGRPFGFQPDWVTHDDGEAARIRDAATRILAGEPITRIVREWNEAGLRTTKARRLWADGQFLRWLCSPRLAGLRTHNGTLYPAEWLPILDEATWVALCSLRSKAALGVRAAQGRRAPNLLTGLLRCEVCKGRMGYHLVNGQPSYRCKGVGTEAGGCVSIALAKADEAVFGVCVLWVADHGAELVAHSGDVTAMLSRVELEASLDVASQNRTALVRDRYRLGIGEADFEATLSGLNDDIARLERSLAGVRAPDGPVVPTTPEALTAAWGEATVAEKRMLVRCYIEGIEVARAVRGRQFDPDRLHITWRA